MNRARIFPEGSELVGKDERILWAGQPTVVGLARRVFHIRPVVGYFCLLAIWNLASVHAAGFRANSALITTAWIALPGLVAVGFVYAMAWVLVATTRYTITDKRVIMQIGTALPIGLTLPLKRIETARLKLNPDGSGDIALALGDQKLAYLLIWPHARPWRFKSAEPMLRAIPDAQNVAAVLARALLKASPTGEIVALETVPLTAPSRGAGAVAA